MPTPFKHHTAHHSSRGGCQFIVAAAWFLIFGYGSFLVWIHQRPASIGLQSSPIKRINTKAHVAEQAQPAKTQISPEDLHGKEHGKEPSESALKLMEKLKSVKEEPKEAEMHVVFSTDCSFYQDWQTLLIFFSAIKVGQKGHITRIASGCEESKKNDLRSLYEHLYPQYGVHFTPDFKRDPLTKEKYDFYNKPYGVQHWLRYNPQITAHTIIAIIDPDMIFLRPLTPKVAGQNNNIFMRDYDPSNEHPTTRVQRGSPVAQLYGLGAPWAVPNHRHFNRTKVCGPNSPCLRVVPRYGELHYSVGPPYLVERDDLIRLTDTWVKMVPTVYQQYPELLAEMYAYSMAAAHEELPHLTVHHYMVSNTEAQDEGWPWIDVLGDDVCESDVNGIYYPGRPLPTMLHYCQFFRVGEWGFQKRRVPKRMFECSGPLLGSIPSNIATTTYKNRDGEIIPITRKYARRNSFMLCIIHRSINAMLSDFKSRMCVGDKAKEINLNTSLNLAKALHW